MSVASDNSKLPPEGKVRQPNKGGNIIKELSLAKSNLKKKEILQEGKTKERGGRRFSPRSTTTDLTKHLEGCTKHSTSKDAQNIAPRRMHITKHLEGCA